MLSQEARALLDRERGIPPLPSSVRARLLTRLGAAPRAGGVAAEAWGSRGAVRTRWAAAAAQALVAGAAVGAVAYGIHVLWTLPPDARPVAPPLEVAAPRPAAATPAADVHLTPAGAIPTPRASSPDVFHAELRLLRRALAAVAREDFAAALSLVAEHTRRFKDRRLVEEREALRVQALAGLGRIAEARRAAGAFEERFPRSVLLPAVRLPASGP